MRRDGSQRLLGSLITMTFLMTFAHDARAVELIAAKTGGAKPSTSSKTAAATKKETSNEAATNTGAAPTEELKVEREKLRAAVVEAQSHIAISEGWQRKLFDHEVIPQYSRF